MVNSVEDIRYLEESEVELLSSFGRVDGKFMGDLEECVSIENEELREFLGDYFMDLNEGVLHRSYRVSRVLGEGVDVSYLEKVLDEFSKLKVRYVVEESKADYLDLIHAIMKLVSVDKKIVGYFESVGKGILEKMNYTLFVENEEEYVLEYIGGELLKKLNVESDNYKGKEIGHVFGKSVQDSMIKSLKKAPLGGVTEFTVELGDLQLRNVVRLIYREDKLVAEGIIEDVTGVNNQDIDYKDKNQKDVLTGAMNREFFMDKLEQMLVNGHKGNKVGVLYIDMDDFKTINDTKGHHFGDETLTELTRRLEKSIRGGDIVGRLGGDEFAIICKRVRGVVDVERIIERVMYNVGEKPFHIEGEEFSISLSVGAAIFPQDGEGLEELLKHADVAMYKAKNGGKNTYRIFDESMNSEAVEKLHMKNELQKAIERSEFYLNYQLQYDAEKDLYVGMEALVRWDHPEKGEISPNDFMEVAEDTGKIVNIGYWVLNEGVKKLASLIKDGYSDMILFVNFSALQFMQKDIVARVKAVLDSHGVSPKNLVLEIDEETAMGDVEDILERVDKLRDLGVLISIDDFGTSYTSVKHLKAFGVTNIKVDKTLVVSLQDEDDISVVKAVVDMGKSLGIDVVAEGVENEVQYKKLKDIGCRLFQGYYFTAPLGFVDVREMLKRKEQVKAYKLEKEE